MEQARKLISPNTGEPCQPAHYLAELSITRKAAKFGKTLPFKFWNTPEWKRDYRLAIMASHSLLKVFELEPILAALNSDDGKWIYSLNYKGLFQLIVREKNRLEVEQKLIDSRPTIVVSPENVNHVPKQQSKKNTFTKLRD